MLWTLLFFDRVIQFGFWYILWFTTIFGLSIGDLNVYVCSSANSVQSPYGLQTYKYFLFSDMLIINKIYNTIFWWCLPSSFRLILFFIAKHTTTPYSLLECVSIFHIHLIENRVILQTITFSSNIFYCYIQRVFF